MGKKKKRLNNHGIEKQPALSGQSSSIASLCKDIFKGNVPKNFNNSRVVQWSHANKSRTFDNSKFNPESLNGMCPKPNLAWEATANHSNAEIVKQQVYENSLDQFNKNKHNCIEAGPVTPNFKYNEMLTSSADSSSHHYLCIIPHDYPNSFFNDQHFEIIQKALFEKLENTPDPLPLFNIQYNKELGVFPVTCQDERAAHFLRFFSGLNITKDITIRVINKDNLPRTIRLIWRTFNVGCRDLPRVLKMLERCNPGLDTSLWKVLETKNNSQWTQRTVLIDEKSEKYIASRNFRIPDGVSNSFFSLSSKKNKKPKPANQPECQPNGEDKTKNNLNNTSPNNEDCSQDQPDSKDSKDVVEIPKKIGPNMRHSWGGIVEPLEANNPIDLTEDYSSFEDDQDFTGEL